MQLLDCRATKCRPPCTRARSGSAQQQPLPKQAGGLRSLLRRTRQVSANALITGEPSQATKSEIASLVGCEEERLPAAVHADAPYSRIIRRLGPPGAGLAAKLLNNLISQGTTILLADGIRIWAELGVGLRALHDVANTGAARSETLECARRDGCSEQTPATPSRRLSSDIPAPAERSGAPARWTAPSSGAPATASIRPRASPPGSRASRRPAGGRLRAAGPSDRPVALAGMLRADTGMGQHGRGCVGCAPIPRNPLRRHPQHPRRKTMEAGQKRKEVIARHRSEMRRPRVGRPADPFVAPLLVPSRGREPVTPQDAMHGRADPVADLPTRRTIPARRTPRLHHRVPAAPVVALGHQLQPDATEVPQPATEPRYGLKTLRRRHLRCRFRDTRLRRRQPETCPRRQLRQLLVRRRSASLPWLSLQSEISPSRRARPQRLAPGSSDAVITRPIVSAPRWRSPICMAQK